MDNKAPFALPYIIGREVITAAITAPYHVNINVKSKYSYKKDPIKLLFPIIINKIYPINDGGINKGSIIALSKKFFSFPSLFNSKLANNIPKMLTIIVETIEVFSEIIIGPSYIKFISSQNYIFQIYLYFRL